MVETAYAIIRREITRWRIMNGVSSLGTSPSEIGSGLATRNKAEKRMTGENSDALTVVVPGIQRRDASNLWGTPSGGMIYRKGKPPPRHRQAGLAARLTLVLPINQHHV